MSITAAYSCCFNVLRLYLSFEPRLLDLEPPYAILLTESKSDNLETSLAHNLNDSENALQYSPHVKCVNFSIFNWKMQILQWVIFFLLIV